MNDSGDELDADLKRQQILFERGLRDRFDDAVTPDIEDAPVDDSPAGRAWRGQEVRTLLEEHSDFFRDYLYQRHLASALLHRAPVEVLEPLIEFLPNSLTSAIKDNENTPLSYACILDATKMACLRTASKDKSIELDVYRLLTTPASARIADVGGTLPLFHYCSGDYSRSLEVVRLLVEAYPESVRFVHKNIGTIVHVLVKRGFCDGDILRYVVDRWPQALLTKNFMDFTPLHAACLCETTYAETVRLLVELCPAPLQIQDDQGRNPLHVALESFKAFKKGPNCPYQKYDYEINLESIQVLASAFTDGVYMPNKKGVTPIQYACEQDMPLDIIFQLVMVDPVAAVAWLSGMVE